MALYTPPGRKINGFDGTFIVDGDTICVSKFSVQATCDLASTPDTCTGGFDAVTPGLRGAKVNWTANYDGTPPELVEGDSVDDLILTHKVAGSPVPVFSATQAFIESVSITNDVPGIVTIEYSGTVNGQYQYGALPTA